MKLPSPRIAKFLLNIGVQASDDVEVQRQRRVLLLVHYLFCFVGPFCNIMLFLGSGMYHSAMMTVFVSLLPTLLSFCRLFTAWRCLCFCAYVITAITFVAPFLVCTFAGGVVNSGFVPQLMFFSPLTWLCTTLRVRSSIALFVVIAIALALHVQYEQRFYDFAMAEFTLSQPSHLLLWHWLALSVY